MQRFGKLIRRAREVLECTQEGLSRLLSEYDRTFSRLTAVTLSRWEHAQTVPSLEKQQKILRFFWGKRVFDDEEFREIYLESLRANIPRITRRLNAYAKGVIGNLPSFGQEGESALSCQRKLLFSPADAERVALIEKALAPSGYYRIAPRQLLDWSRKEGTVVLGCRLKRLEVGHAILLKVSNRFIGSMLHDLRSEFSMETEDFRGRQDRGVFLIHAFHAVNTEVAAYLSTEILAEMIRERKGLEGIAVFGISREAEKLIRFFGHRQVDEGKNAEGGYHWYSAFTSVPDYLFSVANLNGVFQRDFA